MQTLCVFVNSSLAGEWIPDNSEQLTIGRAPDNLISLADSTVDSYHAKVVWMERRFFIVDCLSLNGTFLNWHLIDSAALRDKDFVLVGKTHIGFRIMNIG